jgi:3-hydroxypropanoate dehydrogenase
MNASMNSSLNTLFNDARTANAYLPSTVSDDTLRAIYESFKWGPTSANCFPLRIQFLRTPAARERLAACVIEGNIEKVRGAPVVAVLGMDMAFYEQLPKLFPHTDARSWFVGNAPLIEATALRNSSLQGAYFMIAARAHGLDCGPMSGFDAARVDAEFWSGSTVKTNFICALGKADTSKTFARSPRPAFEEVCSIS